MRTQIEGDWVDPVSTPRLWNFAVATQQDARRNLATETLRLRSAARLGPARSPPPARHAPAPLPAVSVATAPDAKGRPLPVLAEGCDRPWQPQPCRTRGAEPTSCKTRPASALRGWPHVRAQARLPGGPSPRHLDYRASTFTVFSTRCPVSWTLDRSLCDAVLSQCPSALGQ